MVLTKMLSLIIIVNIVTLSQCKKGVLVVDVRDVVVVLSFSPPLLQDFSQVRNETDWSALL